MPRVGLLVYYLGMYVLYLFQSFQDLFALPTAEEVLSFAQNQSQKRQELHNQVLISDNLHSTFIFLGNVLKFNVQWCSHYN